MRKNQLANCTESRANILIIGIICSMLIEIPLCKAPGSSLVKRKYGIACWRPATLVSSPRNGQHQPVGSLPPPALPHPGRRDIGNTALLLRGVDRDPPGARENIGCIHADVHSSFGDGIASGHPHRSTQPDPYGDSDVDRHPHRVHPTLTNAYIFTIANAHRYSNGDIHTNGYANANRDFTPRGHRRTRRYSRIALPVIRLLGNCSDPSR